MQSIKIDKENPEEINITLPHGSVMITGAVQKYFSHEIPKENIKKADMKSINTIQLDIS